MERRTHTRLTPVEHVLKRPGMWIGNVNTYSRTQYVHALTSNAIVKRQIHVIDAFERMFIEALSNATDCISFSRRNDYDLKGAGISIVITDDTITVRNGGIPMPIRFDKKENMWQPEMICGVLFVSSNFGDKREDAGLNGAGIKLTNIFSTRFQLDIGNAETGKRYTQTWLDNMSSHTEPVIQNAPNITDYTQVSYRADYSRFAFTHTTHTLDDDHLALFLNHAINASFNTEIEVKVSVATSRHQFSHTYNLTRTTYLNQFLIPSISKDKVKRVDYVYESATASSKITIIDCETGGGQIHFTNGIENRDGGACVEETLTSISSSIIKRISEQLKTNTRMTKRDVRDRILILMSTRAVNPEFEGQMKIKLNAPTFAAALPAKCLESMMSWNLIKTLAVDMMQKMQAKVNKDAKVGRHKLRIPEVDDANLAGRSPELCRLCIVEGLSAKNHPSELINNTPNGRDIIGIFPLQGKPINTLKHNECEILNNRVFHNLCTTLGLFHGRTYTDTKSLRYGRVDILVDADEDGKHILGLILLFFYTHFPSLLDLPFLYYLRTPIIRATRGDVSIPFYSQRRYKEWLEQESNASAYSIEYFKGLSSSSSEQIFADMADLEYVAIHRDRLTDDYLRLCFDTVSSDRRKEWLLNIVVDQNVETRTRMGVSYIVHNQVSEHSISNYRRTIPGPDGLKRSQRKVLYTMLKHFSNAKKAVGIPQLVGKVMDATAYAHGSANVEKIIISMTQNFVGSNNMPYFEPKGLFGSRIQGGADSGQPRYLGTRPQSWLRRIFLKEDDAILRTLIESGESVEPEFYLPILPMHMINGVDGVGTGWSTEIPPFNPIDICDQITALLTRIIDNNTNFVNEYRDVVLTPWYRGFRGEVTLNPDDRRVTTRAIYNYQASERLLVIEELPIGVWSDTYRRVLDSYMEAKDDRPKYVKDYDRYDTTIVSRFEIKLTEFVNVENLESDFDLYRRTSTANMYTLNTSRIPVKHDTIGDMLINFVNFRLPYYGVRKEHILATMRDEERKLLNRAALIQYYIDGVIDPRTGTTVDILRQCQQLNITEATYNEVKFKDVTRDKVKELHAACDELRCRISEYESRDTRQMWIEDIARFRKWYVANEFIFDIFGASNSSSIKHAPSPQRRKETKPKAPRKRREIPETKEDELARHEFMKRQAELIIPFDQ